MDQPTTLYTWSASTPDLRSESQGDFGKSLPLPSLFAYRHIELPTSWNEQTLQSLLQWLLLAVWTPVGLVLVIVRSAVLVFVMCLIGLMLISTRGKLFFFAPWLVGIFIPIFGFWVTTSGQDHLLRSRAWQQLYDSNSESESNINDEGQRGSRSHYERSMACVYLLMSHCTVLTLRCRSSRCHQAPSRSTSWYHHAMQPSNLCRCLSVPVDVARECLDRQGLLLVELARTSTDQHGMNRHLQTSCAAALHIQPRP